MTATNTGAANALVSTSASSGSELLPYQQTGGINAKLTSHLAARGEDDNKLALRREMGPLGQFEAHGESKLSIITGADEYSILSELNTSLKVRFFPMRSADLLG